MKNLLYFFVASLIGLSTQAAQETHGGDAYALDFLKVYSDLRARISVDEFKLEPAVTLKTAALDEARARLRVVSQPQIFWEGREVSARNTPKLSLIEISQSHWQNLGREQKEMLALHEMLPIVGLIDTDYTYSTQILELLKEHRSLPTMREVGVALISCDQAVLENVSAGLYQSYIPTVRAEFLQIAAMFACPSFLEKAIRFSSLREVQTSCDTKENRTPLAGLVKMASSENPRSETGKNVLRAFDLLFQKEGDQKQFCRVEDREVSSQNICEFMKDLRQPQNEIMQIFFQKAQCHSSFFSGHVVL